jgi:hypothetical protein
VPNISTGWQEQYYRMQRSYQRLLQASQGTDPTAQSSEDVRDTLYHFFQDTYHLKDWIGNDSSVATGHRLDVQYVNNRSILQLCADLCNGTKHLSLSSTRAGDLLTGFSSQSVTVYAPTAGSNRPPGHVEHSWEVTSNNVNSDAVRLAGDVITEWDNVIQTEGIQP